MAGDTVVVVDDGRDHDVFEVVAIEDDVARVRSTYLFEIGEELTVRVGTVEKTARVKSHAGGVTELALEDK